MRGAYKIYNKLTSENKVQFWTISSSCFVAVFTFFIGIVYQFFVVDKSREESRRLYHIQYVDNIKPVLQINQDVDMFSFHVSTQAQNMKDMIHLSSASKQDENIVIKKLQTEMYGFTDSVINFAEKYNKAIEVPKYYLYDNHKDSIQQCQDSIKILIGALKVIRVIARNGEKSEQELDSLISKEHSFDSQQMAALHGYYSIMNKPATGIAYQLECSIHLQDYINQIQKIFKEKAFFSYKEESPYKSLWSVILFGVILLVAGFIIWLLLLNYVVFSKKDKSPNKESETERNRMMDEVSEIVDLYNGNDIIGDEEYVSSPLTIYKRIYNKWNVLRKNVLQQQITKKQQETV